MTVVSSAPRAADTRDGGSGARWWWSLIQDLHIGGFSAVITLVGGIAPMSGRCLDAAADAMHMHGHEQDRQQNPKNLRLLRLRAGHRPGLCGSRPHLRRDPGQERH